MMKLETKIKKLQERITKEKAKAKEVGISSSFTIEDHSTKKELRLSPVWGIDYVIDYINYPKNLEGGSIHPLWIEMQEIQFQLQKLSHLDSFREPETNYSINEYTKHGAAEREQIKMEFYSNYGTSFLDKLRKFSGKSFINNLKKQVVELQAKQKKLLPELRKANSEFISKRKQAKEEKKLREAEFLKNGEFWECETETLKSYFHPPFDKNYLADVSEKWRAALFVECESMPYKDYHKNWRHKLVGTGRGYLCGIDDNGDEWGHEVYRLYQPYDEHGNAALSGTVEEAMSELFGISKNKLSQCYRQGDLLFCSEIIPEETKLYDEKSWEVRESHEIISPNLRRNGHYFSSDVPIRVQHTSHAAIELPAGAYRLYAHQVLDAD
jgi:hypothetical protein